VTATKQRPKARSFTRSEAEALGWIITSDRRNAGLLRFRARRSLCGSTAFEFGDSESELLRNVTAREADLKRKHSAKEAA
jgi:hypothetical protein